jgi:hypothetical protein
MTVIRVALLLDANPKVVSFQSVHRCLQRKKVVNVLMRRLCADSIFPARTQGNIRYSVSRFLDTYNAIDWKDLHGRLMHFRNRAAAHLDPRGIQRQITGDELRILVNSVTVLGECLAVFAPNDVLVRQDEIEDWGNRAAAVWHAATQAESKL